MGVLILMVVFSALTAAPPPDLNAAGASWVAVPLILSGLGFWLDRGEGGGRKAFDGRRA